MLLHRLLPSTAEEISQVLGWSYFFCWSLSFYPQFVLNCRKRATEGLSVDFTWLNFFGFVCYAMFNCMMFWNSRVQSDSIAQHGEGGLVKLNDVFFALHALLLTTLTLMQIYWYARRNGNRPAPPMHVGVKLFITITSLILGVALHTTWQRDLHWDNSEDLLTHNLFTWLGFCFLLSFVKLVVTLLKYFPQAILNFKRKSTIGWSIGNVILDFSGGLLSLAQLCVDSKYTLGSLTHVFDNPVKLFLACFSMGFDILFITQHYLLYPGGGNGLGASLEEFQSLHSSSMDEEEEEESVGGLQNDVLLNRAAIPSGRRRVPTTTTTTTTTNNL